MTITIAMVNTLHQEWEKKDKKIWNIWFTSRLDTLPY